MRKSYVISLLFVGVVIFACSSSRKNSYVFPTEMSSSVQASYKEICDKGKVLYDIHCAHCHTTKKWGKELIPDFTSSQLEAYRIRIANERHEPIMNDEQVPAEDLGMIMTFLTYKSKSGIVVNQKNLDNH
ncbi:MAG: hypothetical protein K9H61_11760 [Bacteroidia bacterium]|nr:hypothetical protein [Bacteroidia bacterium]MCF8428256.1 hypothetical protein [Bacteroidia bacterium]MCF8447663.1 hypothetical protein [Bacteroidia bacterium]